MDHNRRSVHLPRTETAPVIRTEFNDAAGWALLMQAMETPITYTEDSQKVSDYEQAISHITLIDQAEYQGILPDAVLAAAPDTGHDLPYDHLYLVDAETYASDDLRLLGIDISVYGFDRFAPFRVPALQVANIEVNDQLGNLSFVEFSDIPWSEIGIHAAGPGTEIFEKFRQINRAKGAPTDRAAPWQS
ncbi:DUF6924 domain-containing protein [Actinacidiphila sp. bgisy145]|uniref:DUF6924 domain-containing protein n=1 Tax=Actinacidiphila sp. bgisy145 TaxID=3413792 RepID=UPI003EBDEF5A